MTAVDRAVNTRRAPDTGFDDITAAIAHRAARRPDAPAVLGADGRVLSYRDLAADWRARAGQLAGMGIGRRDRVALVTEGGPEAVAVLLAVLGTAVCCPVDPACTRQEFTGLTDRCGLSAAVFAGYAPEGLLTAARDAGLRVLRLTGGRLRQEAAGRAAGPPPAIPETLLLRTSGTTGSSKIVGIAPPTLLAAAAATVRAYRLTPSDRRLNCMPLFHVQGLAGSVLASLLAGSSVVCLEEFQPPRVLAALREQSVTWFSASPAMHRTLLDAAPPGRIGAPALRFVRCGSAALPPALREELEERYGVPVVESYGMSEAHQIASTPLPPDRPRRGMVPTGARVAVRAEDGVIRSGPGSEGEILVTGPNVFQRYVGGGKDSADSADSANSGEAFVEGWFRTGDLGRVAEDGSLLITGRHKDLIDRGGEKIAPRDVEDVLLSHPRVNRAAVFGVPHPVLGEEVAAAVVPVAGTTVTGAELVDFCARRLAPHRRPRRVLVCARLPDNGAGKIQRTALVALAAAAAPEPRRDTAPAADRPPYDEVESAVAELWHQHLPGPPPGRDEDFVAAGGDSLSAASLRFALEERFGIRISLLELYDQANTVARMAGLVRSRAGGRRPS